MSKMSPVLRMAKNMQSTGFRALNVDAYNEDQYEEEEVDTPGVGPDEASVQAALAQGRLQEALRGALANPPLKTKNQGLKDRAVALMLSVLTSFKSADMDKAVNELDEAQLDLLMKYLYKGFERPMDGSSAVLLAWHEKVFAKGGLGCIVRNFTSLQRL